MDILLSGQLLVSALVLGALYALIALGLNLIYGTMRLLNVAHGDILMLGGYVAFWAFTLLDIPPVLSMFVAFAAAAGLGAIAYSLIFRRVLTSTAVLERIEANSLLVFFGISVIIQNLTGLVFSANERAYSYLDQVIDLGGTSVGADRLLSLVVALSACAACVLFFRFSRVGLAVRALIQQRDAASLVGIDTDRINLLVFCLGFGLAGLAGTLISMTEQVSPFIGFPFTIAAFVIIILGGLGNLYGSLAGAFILAGIEVYGVALTSSSYRSILVYGVFIAILLLRPQGLFNRGSPAR